MELGSECLVIDDWQFGITVIARETIIVMLQDIWEKGGGSEGKYEDSRMLQIRGEGDKNFLISETSAWQG